MNDFFFFSFAIPLIILRLVEGVQFHLHTPSPLEMGGTTLELLVLSELEQFRKVRESVFCHCQI